MVFFWPSCWQFCWKQMNCSFPFHRHPLLGFQKKWLMTFCLCSCNVWLQSDFTSDTYGNISAVNWTLSNPQQVTKAIVRCSYSPSVAVVNGISEGRFPSVALSSLCIVVSGHHLHCWNKYLGSVASKICCRSLCFEALWLLCCSS